MDQSKAIRLEAAGQGFNLPWLGDSKLNMPIRASDTANAYSAQLNVIPPGYQNPPHCHGREDEVFYVIDGSVDLQAGHDWVTLNEGDLLFAPRGVPHQLTNTSEKSTSLLVLLTPGDLESAFIEGSKDLGQLGQAFEESGVVILERFDPDFVHPEVVASDIQPLFVARATECPRYWMAGDTYTVLLPGDAAGERLSVVHFDIPPGGGPIPHIHRRDDEAFFVLDGEVTLYADGDTVLAHPGDVVVLPRDVPHGFTNRSGHNAEMLAIVNPSGFDRMIAEVGRPAVPGLPTPPMDDAEKERLHQIAPKYGVEVRPDIDFH